MTPEVQAADSSTLLGTWKTHRAFAANGERHEETEILRFNPGSFRMQLFTTIRKGPFLVKNLRIEATGIWKRRDRILVLMLQQIRFTGVDETRGINQASFNTLVRQLRGRYLSDPIRILSIQALGEDVLSLDNGDGTVKDYKRTAQ